MITDHLPNRTIQIGKTYNGATVVEIAPGADKWSREVIKYKLLPSNIVHQCSRYYFVENFLNKTPMEGNSDE